MEKIFEIAGVGDQMLSVGSRVEIFDAGPQQHTPQRVSRMRVGGDVLVFEKGAPHHPQAKAFDADEGEIVSIERSDGKTRFSVRLRP